MGYILISNEKLNLFVVKNINSSWVWWHRLRVPELKRLRQESANSSPVWVI